MFSMGLITFKLFNCRSVIPITNLNIHVGQYSG
jgi:hypothetical protein